MGDVLPASVHSPQDIHPEWVASPFYSLPERKYTLF